MRTVVQIIVWILFCLGIIALLGFIDHTNKNRICKGIFIRVDHPDNVNFLDQQDILELIHNYGYKVDGQSSIDIDAGHIEQFLNNNPFVKNAEVYITIDGYLNINIRQRIPLIRIINANGESYYIDTDGWLMPLSGKYTADVPVASGNIHEPWALRYHTNMCPLKSLKGKHQKITILNHFYTLAKYIRANPFWDDQIAQIYLDENAEILLIPRIGNHKIILGDITDLEKRMNNLKIFYQKGLSSNWLGNLFNHQSKILQPDNMY